MGDESISKQRPGSWLATFQALVGSREHKRSFVIFDVGQSGCITLTKWFKAKKNITFQEDVLSQPVRFPRLSVYQRIRQSQGAIYGFSLTVEQLRQVQRMADPNQFFKDLYRGECRMIFLQRRDALRHAIATLKAYSVSCRFGHAEQEAPNSRVTVDTSELLDCLRYLDHQRLEARAILHDVPHLSLIYEDDLMDPNDYAATARKVSNFLEIPNIEPVGSSLKLVHQKLSDIVTNYEEVCKAVESSDYAYLLTSRHHLLSL